MNRGPWERRPLRRRDGFVLVTAAGVSAAVPGARMARAANSGDWPSQPVRYINLFPPGGATDVMSRLWCAKMSEITEQQFIVENRAGAGGTVGQAAIAKAAPDGYTIGLGSIASLAIAPSLYPSLPYDPARDFTYVSGIWKVPNVLIANLDLPVRSLPELIDLLRANPRRYSYGSGGSGTSPHLTMELVKQRTGVDILHVPYRGGAPALIDLLAGRIQVMFDNIPTVIGAVRDGKVRPLAVTSAEPSPALPNVPTVAEVLPGFEITSWGGVVGPPGLPGPMVRRMNDFTRRSLEDPGLIRAFRQHGGTTWWTTPEEFASFRAREEAMFAELIRASGARVD
jgi:tripartite-type tricarboxylate transporter receptor subunit TctC